MTELPPLEPVRRPANHARLLWSSLALASAGALATLAGARMTWRTVTTPGRLVPVDGGSAALPDTVRVLRGDDLASGATVIGVLLVAAVTIAVLAGPRARTFAAGVVVVLGAVAAWQAVMVAARTPTYPAEVVIASGAGRDVFGLGGVLAVFGGAGALPVARRVPRVGMPERSADEASDPV